MKNPMVPISLCLIFIIIPFGGKTQVNEGSLLDQDLVGIEVGDQFTSTYEEFYRSKNEDDDPVPGDLQKIMEITSINLTTGQYSLDTYWEFNSSSLTEICSLQLTGITQNIVDLKWDEYLLSGVVNNGSKSGADYTGRAYSANETVYNRPNEFEWRFEHYEKNGREKVSTTGIQSEFDLKRSIWNKSSGVVIYQQLVHTRLFENKTTETLWNTVILTKKGIPEGWVYPRDQTTSLYIQTDYVLLSMLVIITYHFLRREKRFL